jgi:hypothetical protein
MGSKLHKSNISCQDGEQLGRPTIVIGDILHKFLAKCPFASVKNMSRHFGVSASTVKEILIHELGFR